MRKVLLSCLTFCCMIIIAKGQNFSYTPDKPKPGETITITYTPAGDIANTMKPLEVAIYSQGQKGRRADDLEFKKAGAVYTASYTTDTGMSFVYFSFSADGKFDNNFNKGYWILLYDNGIERKGAYFALSTFYQYLGRDGGVESNTELAQEALEKEFRLYPENRKTYCYTYCRLILRNQKEKGPELVQKEIEALLKQGLKEESDYSNLESLYSLLKLPEQSKYWGNLKKEKYPDGSWQISETMMKFNNELDAQKKASMLREIIARSESDKKWEVVKPNMEFFRTQLLQPYMKNKDWEGFSKMAEQMNSSADLASMYNTAAWEMQKTSDHLEYAEQFSRKATMFYKARMQDHMPSKPDYMSGREWKKQTDFMYAMYADTYGMIMYRMGQYKKGLPYAKEAALTINKGKDPDQNNTYALLAEKVLPAKQVKKELEQFVKDGKATGDMKDILQRIYVKEKGSETGFNDYIAVLQKENQLKMLEELRKSMLSEKAPSFALLDMNGKKLDITELRGKVVVVDFWATWCGPCKASFPGMQKMVNKYKDNNDVKFIFVDTWEQGDAKEKNAAEFIASNKYSFHVLMDNDNKVVEQFKVEGIPTKFILDKNGLIRFKAVGFDGSDDKLMSELTAMIEMATEASTQKGF